MSAAPMLNAKILCYLSPEAEKQFNELTTAGLDPDLAVSVLETLLGESIYEIPEEEDVAGRTYE